MKALVLAGLTVAACILMLLHPAQVLSSAKEAMVLWANSFAPALFPFFVITPALCCQEARDLCGKVFDRVTTFLFGIPGSCSGAILIGLMAGSPAGSTALKYNKEDLTVGQASKALLACSGLSPAFYISCVGEGLLHSPSIGRVLFRSQLLAVLYSAFILRSAFSQDREMCIQSDASSKAKGYFIKDAVLGILTVCGWMVCFHVLCGLVDIILPVAGLKAILHPALEISGGCWTLANADIPDMPKLIILSFYLSFGGIAVMIQNAANFPDIRKIRLLFGKILQGLLSALFTCMQTAFPLPYASGSRIVKMTFQAACLMPIAAFIAVITADMFFQKSETSSIVLHKVES